MPLSADAPRLHALSPAVVEAAVQTGVIPTGTVSLCGVDGFVAPGGTEVGVSCPNCLAALAGSLG